MKAARVALLKTRRIEFGHPTAPEEARLGFERLAAAGCATGLRLGRSVRLGRGWLRHFDAHAAKLPCVVRLPADLAAPQR